MIEIGKTYQMKFFDTDGSYSKSGKIVEMKGDLVDLECNGEIETINLAGKAFTSAKEIDPELLGEMPLIYMTDHNREEF